VASRSPVTLCRDRKGGFVVQVSPQPVLGQSGRRKSSREAKCRRRNLRIFRWGPVTPDDSSRHDGRRGSIADRRGGGRNSRQTDLPSHPRSVSRSWARPLFQHQRSNNTRLCYSTCPLRVASATAAQRILARLEHPSALQSRREQSPSSVGKVRNPVGRWCESFLSQ
jgi:hypothetical protein